MQTGFTSRDLTSAADGENNNPSDPNATPKYGLFGSWSCADWITWHKALKAALGKEAADAAWIKGWNGQGFWDPDQSWCKYNTDFNNYCKSANLPVSWILPNVVVGAQNVVNNIADTATSTSNTLKWLIPAVLIGVAGIGLYFVYSKAKTS